MRPTTFQGKRYYLVKGFYEGSCNGCVLESDAECPQNTGPRSGMCAAETDIILIHRTKTAVAAYVARKLEVS
jgi:hypothetical protein